MFSWWPSPHKLVDRHFGQGKPLRSVGRLWRHLETCEACQKRYRGHALLEALDEAAPHAARERLAPRALRGTDATYLPVPRMFALGGAGLALAAFALFMVPQWRDQQAPFVARGAPGAVSPASLSLYRIATEHPPHDVNAGKSLAGGHIVQGEGLAFSYTNDHNPGYAFLMVFAVDANGHIAWFWPAWQDTHTNHQAIPINSGGTFELPEAVFHEFPIGQVELVGLFMNAPLHVKDVETLVAAKTVAGMVLPNTFLWRQTIEVKAP